MSERYLLAISIGPVQDFIAAARRTRDLWFGSYMLSEISKALAADVERLKGELIFPVDVSKAASVPSKILALFEQKNVGSDSPLFMHAIVHEIEKRIQEKWIDFANEALASAKRHGLRINEELWKLQIEDVIEFYAAWVPVRDRYSLARQRVEKLLAGRKAFRDFRPGFGKQGVPKSTLDGMRESVLLSNPPEILAKAGIRANEHLDAVGLIKRLAKNEPFPSVVRVAIDPWLRGVGSTDEGAAFLHQVIRLCDRHHMPRLTHSVYKNFPYSGSFFLDSRLDSMIKDGEISAEFRDGFVQYREQYDIVKKFGFPIPYVAVLMADGDRMGDTIGRIEQIERHREFSKKLSAFSALAKQIVEENHGVLIYSGGDDVLAFLPLDTCLKAAKSLQLSFRSEMDGMAEGDIYPTLSVGIGIGHCLEPLEYLLRLGRLAEKKAKQPGDLPSEQDRNGLAILYQTRSGGEALQVRMQWTELPVEQIEAWAELYLYRQLPVKLAHDIREMGRFYMSMASANQEMIQADVRRMLTKKRSQGEPISEPVMDKLLAGVDTAEKLLRLGDLLVMSSKIADCLRQTNRAFAQATTGGTI